MQRRPRKRPNLRVSPMLNQMRNFIKPAVASKRITGITNARIAQWTRFVAHRVQERCGRDAMTAVAALGFKLQIEPVDPMAHLVSRCAVWEGDRQTIRLFMPSLRRCFSNIDYGMRLACAHECFHGLCARNFAPLQLLRRQILPLSFSQEEQAAAAFARFFCGPPKRPCHSLLPPTKY